MQERSNQQRERESLALKERKLIHQGNIISCYQDRFIFSKGKTKNFDFIKHPGAVGILPVDDQGRLVLIRQWRRAAEKILIEIPAGTLEPGESPIECAQREVREETGFEAKTLIPLPGLHTAPGFCNEYIHLFLAKDLFSSPLWADDSDDIDLFIISLPEALNLAVQGEITDAKTLSALFLYQITQIRP